MAKRVEESVKVLPPPSPGSGTGAGAHGPGSIREFFRGLKPGALDRLSVVELFKLLERVEGSGSLDATSDDGNMVMVMGNTGCGKSTILNLIMGNKLRSIEELPRKVIKLVIDKKLNPSIAAIGEGQVAPRGYTSVVFKDVEKGTGLEKYIEFWDNPGFGDNRSAQQEILNAYLVNKLFTRAKGFKLLNLIDYASVMNDNPAQFKSYVKHIKDLFGNDMVRIPQCLVVTKVEEAAGVVLKDVMSVLMQSHYKDDFVVQRFFTCPILTIPRAEKAGEEWGVEKVKGLMETLEKVPYEKHNVQISISAEAKLFLHERAYEVSQALITEYLKCFNGRTLLTYFYGGVIKYAVDNKVAINSEVRLGDSFSSALATSIGAYKTSHLKAYKQYESAVTEFMGRVCESVKISPPVLKMKELVDRHCNYELKYCTGKHVLRYFAKLAALAGLTEKEKELSKAIEEMRKEPLSFEKFGNSISEILAAQKICDKAVVDAATAPTEAVKAERQQAAQKRFEARCDEIDKENLKLGRSFSEKLIPKLALVTKAVAEASKAALERGAHKLEGLALAALTAIEIFFSEKKSVQMVELVRVGSFEEFIVASELFSDTIKRIALGDTIEIKPELLGDAFETLTLTE